MRFSILGYPDRIVDCPEAGLCFDLD